MNTKSQKKEDQKGADDRTPQVGALLRASRLRVGDELREVADVLCIRFLYLEAIEECRYADLPGDTYAVGFIRSYAEHLGLDGDEVVRRYRAEQVGKGNSSELSFPTPVQDSGVPKGAIVFVGFLIALLVYGGWYVTTTDESILSDIISPVPDRLKHLVTGDDAPDGSNVTPSDSTSDTPGSPETTVDAPSYGSATTDASPSDEDTVRASSDAAAQIANAAGEVAARTADAARAAAESAAEAVTAEPSTPEPTNAAPEQAIPEVSTDNSASTSSAPQTALSDPVEAVAPEVPAEAPVQVNETPSDTATTPNTPETANTTAVVATPETSGAPAVEPDAVPNTAAQTAESAVTAVPVTATETSPEAAATATETAPENATPPASTEVTAEDLNALVLRQATSTNEQTVETASTNTTTATSGVTISATSRSWVEVRNPSNGTVLFTGVMSVGSTFDVPDTDGLLLDTGNAGALNITVEGVSVPSIGGIGDVRKSVSLDPERLKAGTATNR